MKKLFSWLTVFVLALSLVLPASAYNFNGTELPSLPSGNYSYYFIYGWGEGNYTLVASSNPLKVTRDKTELIQRGYTDYIYKDGNWKVNNTLGDNEGDNLATSIFVPIWSNYDILTEYTGELYFEGSEYEFPPYPELPVVSGTYKHYVLSRASSGRYDYSVFVSDTPFTATGERTNIYSAKFSSPVTIYRYSSTNGGDWVKDVDGATNSSFTVGSNGYLELVASSFTWYDESGEPFFPPPLWETVGMVTQGEMGALTQETAGTMKVLALSGVGLMALLVVLSLFGKRSLIFLR